MSGSGPAPTQPPGGGSRPARPRPLRSPRSRQSVPWRERVELRPRPPCFQTEGAGAIGWRARHVTNGRGKAAESEQREVRRARGQRRAEQPIPRPGRSGAGRKAQSAARRGRERGSPSGWAAMSFLSLQPTAAPRRVSARRAAAPIRQKLLFLSGHSDCEEEDEDEEEEEGGSSGNSTGEDSAFQEADSPLSVARTPARGGPPLLEEEEEMMEPAAAPLPDEGDSWEEEGFGSSPVKSPGAYFTAGSPSPPPPHKGRRSAGRSPPHPAAGGCRLRGDEPGSPLPDYPGTPPHKTFRKLRLFDTPHTPKVSERGSGRGGRYRAGGGGAPPHVSGGWNAGPGAAVTVM